ncbi:hypothetical protein FJT64_014462 [Amphibalanus amphitrite]|uniref:Uncharacterized protein n=1 Tax=Amphibalanus amphitrite TaxID=1232801 RepID=A0A6A4V643_AMPAM|nr:hypothetical protein FJT64_014462 [Amphibalanus amphitrite]
MPRVRLRAYPVPAHQINVSEVRELTQTEARTSRCDSLGDRGALFYSSFSACHPDGCDSGRSPAIGEGHRLHFLHNGTLGSAAAARRTWSGGGCRPESLSRHGRGPVAAVCQSPSPDTDVVRWRLPARVPLPTRTWSGGGCRPESLSRHGYAAADWWDRRRMTVGHVDEVPGRRVALWSGLKNDMVDVPLRLAVRVRKSGE